MASMSEEERALFPLRTVSSVVELFKLFLTRSDQPDLALMSIISGLVENTLTCHLPAAILSGKSGIIVSVEESQSESNNKPPLSTTNKEEGFPEVDLDIVEALYAKFRAVVRSSVELENHGRPRKATREMVKKVSDVIWNTLTRSYYKDRAHLQSLYSYLTGNKLDCFGVALAVVAGCQVLGFDDVHLALSEDHAWVVFGPDGQETAEVTWHGKGNEDKRGQPVDAGIQARSWLYVAGHPVVCSRFTEAAALVSSINPSVTATTDSQEVSQLQQSLLWVLYDLGHLDRYPMALGNLADLEEQSPTTGRIHCSQIFSQAIEVSRRMYGNAHVYPYTYQGGYFYRNRMYKEALESWANAADAIRSYNYSREDEEIYKEFLEIANELIPFVMKVEGSGISARSILKDSECFAHLLRFYDGICQWEEGSCTPVLHIGWAKPLVNTISKFDAQVRRYVDIHCSSDEDVQEKDSHPATEGGRTELDANANQVLVVDVQPESQRASEAVQLGTTALAALTDLCGRKLLSPSFFLGPSLPASSQASLNVSGGTDGARDKAVEPDRPQLYLRSHKMAGLKDLLMSEKLNTHAISLQLTAQSQVQLGSRTKVAAGRPGEDAPIQQSGKELMDRNNSPSVPGKNPDISQAVPSRPKRTRKE